MTEQQMTAMQWRMQELVTEMNRLNDHNMAMQTRIDQLTAAGTTGGAMAPGPTPAQFHAAVTAMTDLATRMSTPKKPQLIDNRGLGKPLPFNNKEEDFQRWSQRTESFFTSVFPEVERMLEWCLEQTTEMA